MNRPLEPTVTGDIIGQMKRLHIVGRKNSGKTTLIVDLVRHLTALGHRVGTIKHTHHQHELDTPGKDSHRHRQAGAAAVGIVSPTLHAVFWPPPTQLDPADPYEQILRALPHCDLVLVEGHLRVQAAKIEVWRAATATPPYAAEDTSIRAVVTDDPVAVSTPVWRRSDLPELARQVLAMVSEGP